MALPKLSGLLAIGLLTAIYGLLAKLSLSFAIPPGNTSAAWPATGLAVAACLIYGYRIWPAVLIGSALANATTAAPIAAALSIGVGNVAGVLATTWLIRRYAKIENKFFYCADVFKFFVFAATGALISSVIGPTAMLAAGYLMPDDFPRNWITWWLGNLAGMMIATPLVITWRSNTQTRWNRYRIAEILLFSVLFVACAFLVFSLSYDPLLYLFLPFFVWLAFRFTQSEVSKAVFALAVATVWGTAVGRGPMAHMPFNSALLLLLIFVSIISITGLALSVALDERSRSATKLRKIQEDLESLVALRTRQLQNLVDALLRDIAAREAMRKEMQAKEKQLEEAQKLAHLGSWSWDMLHDRLTVSAEMASIYGIPAEDQPLTYAEYLEYIPPEERHLVDEVIEKARYGVSFHYEHHVVRPDGALRDLYCRGAIETCEDGKPVRLYGTAHDLTEEKELARKLQEAEELYRMLVELSPDAIYLLDEARCTFSNKAGLQLFGASDSGQLLGNSFLDFLVSSSWEIVRTRLAQLGRGESLTAVEAKMKRFDGSVIDIELAASAFRVRGRENILLVARDISERKRAEEEIQHLAHHDALTGLSNRSLFKERLEHAIAQSHRTRKPLFVLFIDLDRFKSVNDTSGHGAGDQVLRECAQRLRECLRESDTVARAGGDEFLVLIESHTDKYHASSVAQKILAAVKRPFYVSGKEFEIGASIGISTYPIDGKDVETLIRQADIAMYRVKMEGKNHFRYYFPSMTEHNLERYKMESALRHALERGEMELYYQPKVDLHSGGICGAEALIRWNHPQYGTLLPYRFIPIAEEIGMITELGLWTMQKACTDRQSWQERGLPGIRIAVNLAYPQFSDERFFERIKDLLEKSRLEPDAMELEITETMVMQNAESLMHSLQQLKQFGVHLSIDDFGTGYSSLAYLKRLPVDSVKVDRSFIRDIPCDSDDAAIIHAILALVHSLKREVIAEGVETREQLRFLVEEGCDTVQGFYFSPALAPEEFCKLLSRRQRFMI